MEPNNSLSLKISKISFALLIALVPLFFLPVVGVDSVTAKKVLVIVLLAVAALGLFINRSKNKYATTIGGLGFWALVALPVVFLVSSLAKGQKMLSVFGYGFEITTVSTLLLLSAVALVSWALFNQKGTTSLVKKGLLVSFGVIALYQVLRLFVPQATFSFGQFNGVYGTPIGKWNDVALLSSLFFIGSYLSMKGKQGKGLYSTLLLFAVASFLLKVVAFTLVWSVIAVVILIAIVADIKPKGLVSAFKNPKSNFHTVFGVVVAAALLVASLAANIATVRNQSGAFKHPNLFKVVYFVPNLFGGVPNEARPSIISSASVFSKEIQESPIFGTGSNRFVEAWVKYRNPAFMQSPYWNTNFLYGFGYMPTLATEGGVVGAIAVLALTFAAFLAIFRISMRNQESNFGKSVVYGTLALLVFSWMYVPAFPLLVLLFVGLGYVFARSSQGVQEMSPNKMMSVVGLVALVVLGVVLVQSIRTTLAVRNYVYASQAVTVDKNIDNADLYLQRAMKYSSFDTFKRAYADLLLLKAQVIVAQGTNQDGSIKDDSKNAALASYKQAEQYAEAAIATYPTNYTNYLYAANVYAGDPETQVKAADLYTKSLTYNPNNPEVYYGIAKIKANQNDIDGVKENLKKALEVREYYTPALIAGAQVTALEKDVNSTLGLLVKAYQSDTSRVDLLLEVANIQYTYLKDIKAATETLEKTVGMYPNYADARLALSNLYAKQGNFEDAANLLVGIKTDNEQIKAKLDELISALRNKKDPYGGSVQTQTKATSATSTKAVATSTKAKK